MKIKTYYYSDPINDDFAGNDINAKSIPSDYDYIPRSPLFKTFAFLSYRLIARPVTYLYIKIAHHHRYVNKKALRATRNSGCFLFGNHTLEAGDAFIPNHFSLRKNYIVTNPDAVSIKGLGTVVKMFGALPVPSTVHGAMKYKAAVRELIEKNKTVTIYPEAHIWPYYTGIRPFPADSFSLPVDIGAPCYSFTNVYLKSRNPLIKRPVVKTYVRGPFYPDETLPTRERVKDLRDRVYRSMVEESEKQKQYVTNVYIEKKK